METESCEECLRYVCDNGITTLNIYWLEDIKDGDNEWWIDVCEDQVDSLCEIRWVFCVISKTTVDRELIEDLVDYGEDDDDSVIVVDKPFSKDVVKQAIEGWLKEKKFKFEVNVIEPEGTDEALHILSRLNEVE